MKTFIFFMVALLAFVMHDAASSQKEYKVGYKAQYSLTSSTSISVTPKYSVTLYTLSADTNVTFNAVTTYALPADQVVFRVKGNTRQRIIAWGTNIDSPNDTIATNKTWTFSFIWDGTAYKKQCKAITD